MVSLLRRPADMLFFIFFITHIPITLLIDAQAVLPAWVRPKPLRDVIRQYSLDAGDPFMLVEYSPLWFRGIVTAELIFQVPVFFLAALAFWRGSPDLNWLRTLLIVYSSHVITTMIPILSELIFRDYSSSPYGPKTSKQRMFLSACYLPYLIVPILLLVRVLSSPNLWKSKTR